jgi:hypothetical protein
MIGFSLFLISVFQCLLAAYLYSFRKTHYKLCDALIEAMKKIESEKTQEPVEHPAPRRKMKKIFKRTAEANQRMSQKKKEWWAKKRAVEAALEKENQIATASGD